MKKYLLTVFLIFSIAGNACAWKKISDLPLEASPAGTDLVEITHDPGGTPISKKATIASLSGAMGGGDVLGVGDCAGGDCNDGSSDGGTYIRLYDGDSNYGQFQTANLTANRTYTFPDYDATMATIAGTETLTNKRVTARVTTAADATSITPAGDTSDLVIQANTQTAGTLTINAPSGTPTNGQRLQLRIKSTNVQTFSWNAIYRGSTDLPLETATSGGTLTDYYLFQYNTADSKWDFLAKNIGF